MTTKQSCRKAENTNILMNNMNTAMNTSYQRNYGSAQVMRLVCAMVVMLFAFGIGNAWAGGGGSSYDVKSSVTVSIKTGAGTVYVNTESPAKNGSSATGTATAKKNKDTSDYSSETKDETFYIDATPSDGYYFSSWEHANYKTSPSTSSAQASGVVTAGETETSATSKANFSAVGISASSGTPATLNPTDLTTTYSTDITFTTSNADEEADFKVELADKSGHGTFTPSIKSYSNNTITVTVSFVGGSSYGGNDQNRNNSTKVKLLSYGGENSLTTSGVITANFPAANVTNGAQEEKMYPKPSETKGASAVFDVEYVDALEDFTLPTVLTGASHAGDTWAIDTEKGISLSSDKSKVTIPVTITPASDATGDRYAYVTLGGVSVKVEAEVVVDADYDVAVIDANGASLGNVSWSDALTLANANAGSTMKIARDIELGSIGAQTFTQNTTIDLNGKTITATLSAAGGLLKLNTAGKTLTITDTKTGGAINVSGNINGRISVVDIQKGSLNLIKGDLTVTNANTNNGSEGAPLCAGVYLAQGAWSGGRPTVTMSMSGGSVTARRTGASGNFVYGICCCGTETNAASVDLTGGSVTATNANGTYAVGVFCAGRSTISNMSITASSTQFAYAVFAHHISGKVVISGGTYRATTSGANTRGILTRGEVSFMDGTIIASGTDDVHGIYLSYGTAIINGGNITSTASTGKAYALSVNNGSNYAAKINGGTLTANGVTESQGVKLSASTSLETTGGTINANSVKSVASATDVNAYGVNVVSGSTANISGTTINATTGSSEVGLNNKAYGINNAGTLTLTNAKVNARSWHQWAYGVYTTKSTTISGCEVSATTKDIRANGLYINDASATVTAINSSFSADAGTTYAYGVYDATGSLTSTNCTYYAITRQTGASAAADSYSRGIYHTGTSTVTLNGDEITATGNETYSQGAYGLYSNGANAKAIIDNVKVSATGVNTGYALWVESSSSQTINSGKFKGQTASLGINTPGTIKLNGGFYSHKTNIATSYMPTGYGIFDVPSEMAEQGQGYYYKIGSKSNPGINVCKIGSTNYKTLEEALVKVTNGQTIVMTADYTLPAGDYILPSGATLLIPKNNSQTTANGTSSSNWSTSSSTRTPYKTLTFAAGTHLVSYGTIETGADLYCNGQYSNQGSVYGPFGHIKMEKGSLIELQNGANLWSWGYITGEGMIDAKSGSKILEDFQIANWPGGTNASNMIGNRQDVMPIDQYFIQNIECDIIFRPGSSEVGATAVNMSIVGKKGTNDIRLVGNMSSASLFLMDEKDSNPDTWVKKSYDKATDYITWTVNSGASIGKLKLSISGYAINSEEYTLPMANNMRIVLNYGKVYLTQDLVFLPGSELIVNKEATGYAQGSKLYFYDKDDWVGKMYYASYSPSWGTTNPRSSLATKDKDAKLLAKGTIEFSTKSNVTGGPYTTSHGADICSTNEDAGKIVFGSGALGDAVLYYLPTSGSTTTGNVPVTTAQLHNGSGYATEYQSTTGTTAGQLWGFRDNHWIKMTQDNCLYTEVESGKTLAYPSSFLEVELNDPDDHAYHGVVETDRYVINTQAAISSKNCVWWDAQPEEDGDYMVTNEGSGYTNAIFHYDSSVDYWKPYTFDIDFYNGTTKLGTSVVYKNVQPKFTGRFVAVNGTVTNEQTPSKSADTYYYYTWDGWVLDNAHATDNEPNDKSWVVYSNDDMPRAKANATYYAHFKKTGKQYMITFKDADGSQLQQGVQNAGSTAVYNGPTPTKTATETKVYTFNGWSPSLANVTDAATYTATYSEANRPYTITFANYNGDKLQETEVAYGIVPAYSGAEPTRANSGFWSYDFRGWRAPNGDEYAKNATLPTVSGTATYTALYTETDWTPEYTITFKDGDGKTLTTQYVRQGNTPAYAGVAPTKTATAQYSYTFNNTWSPSIVAATADITYTAQFNSTTNNYTITFTDENDVVKETKSVAYGSTPSYTGPSLAKAQDDEYTYELAWSPAISSVTGDATYKATYNKTKRSYTITWKDDEGNTLKTEQVAYGTTPSYGSTPPIKSQTVQYTYTFANWFPSLRPVTGNMTYQAQFGSVLREYTVTIAAAPAGYGTVDITSVADVPYGTTLSTTTNTLTANGTTVTATPTTATAQYTYAFDNWTNGNVTVNGNVSVTANFIRTTNKYDVTFDMQGHGEAIAQQTAKEYGSKVSQPDEPTETGYTFGGWYKESGCTNAWDFASDVVTGITTLYAKWNPNTNTAYVVEHYKQQLDGTYSSTPDDTDNLTGTTATSVTPDRKSYSGFTAPSGQTVTILADGSRVVTYNYTRNSYTLAWVTDGDALTGSYTTGSVKYGATITAPNTPTKTGYTFNAWTPAFTGIMPAANTEYTATWTPNTNTKYTVKHLLQNLADDYYTEATDDREIKEGTTATTTAATANTYTGFTAQPISQGTIAADGLAVVNVYYNRNKYTITWLDGDGTTIETDENVKFGATPSYGGSTPTKSDDEDCMYTFAGMWTPTIETVTGDQSYTALFNASLKGDGFGIYLDIVDWTASTLTINANGWAAAGWPYTVNGVVYQKSDRADDRTLTIPYSGSADGKLDIVVRKTGGVNYSGRSYTIPHIYNSSATMSSMTASSIVFVCGGSLTVAADAIVEAIYVAPDAELIVNEDVTLTLDSLMLRTTAWKAASLENNGTIAASKTYYTRIVAYNSGYQQFALPLASSISGMHLSNYSKCTYGQSWILKSYNEASRAANGDVSTEEISNWDVLTAETNTISAAVGYEMYSNTPYYREFYFPVTLPVNPVTTVPVSRTENGASGKAHAGWNAICSPLTGKFKQNFGNNPEDGMKVSFLTEEGNYWQYVPQIIYPAIPFYYQAPKTGTLTFSGMMQLQAPQRAWNASIPTQWLQLSVNDMNGKMLDQTNIYSHQEKFSVAYETGYDVAKQSTEGGRAAIYTELPCGKLAFAAIPDSLAATRVPLTVYAGTNSEYTITLEDNGYTGRLQYVLLHDTETGAITDLMSGSYTIELTQGTNAGRFYIECVFHEDAPAIATGTDFVDTPKKEVGQKIIYNEKIFILYRGRIYDMTGRQCELH